MDDPKLASHPEPKLSDESVLLSFAAAQSRTNLLRRVSLILAAALALGLFYYSFTPKARPSLQNPLDALAYEAMAMLTDTQGERLHLPSEDSAEIERYFQLNRSLDFSPRQLTPLPPGWKPVGAALLDYDVAKIAAVQYRRDHSKKPEALFLFTLAGNLQDLPAATPVSLGELHYQPYASDRLNMIAWQASPTTLAVLIGHASISTLASLAQGAEALR